MSGFRFVHSSDLHLGRPYAAIPQDEGTGLRGRLIEARHQALRSLADVARAQGAAHILLAGDTFDSPAPRPAIVAQAMAAMAEDPGLTWWLLPGNHDNLRDGEPLWDVLEQGPAQIRPLRDAAPVEIAPGVTLLSAPVTHRAPGRDLTEALDQMPSPEGALRLGLAHGGVAAFGEADADIAPDRDRRARLDYLALGDWHGRKALSPRAHYSGTPEQDRFKHDRRGVALAVTLDAPGEEPRISEVETGRFLWRDLPLDLLPERDPVAALDAVWPKAELRDLLLRVTATGRTTLQGYSAMQAALEAREPTLARLIWRAQDLRIAAADTDLDRIEATGPLRAAAEQLAREAQDPERSARDQRLAEAALARLFALTEEAGS